MISLGRHGQVAEASQWTVEKQVTVVLRLLQGESIDMVSTETGVPVDELDSWRRVFLKAAADALKMEGVTVVGWAGDGGTADIGIQALSGMLERRTDGVYVMYDNEAYMNTGIQRSGATPEGAWTTTTPVGAESRGKAEPKKDIMGIVAAHYPAYAATLNVAFPEDFLKKVQKARDIKGPQRCP